MQVGERAGFGVESGEGVCDCEPVTTGGAAQHKPDAPRPAFMSDQRRPFARGSHGLNQIFPAGRQAEGRSIVPVGR